MNSEHPGRPGGVEPGRGPRNALIAAMSDVDRSRLLALSSDVVLEDGTTVCRQGERMDCAYFPVSGAIALLSAVAQRSPVALGLVGREGVVGPMLAFGPRIAIVDGVAHLVCRPNRGEIRPIVIRERALSDTQAANNFMLNYYWSDEGSASIEGVVIRLTRDLV